MKVTRDKPQTLKRKGVVVINRTYYRSDDIAKIVQACMKEHEGTHGARDFVEATVTYSRYNGTTGYAYYNSGVMRIRLGKPWGSTPAQRATWAAKLIEHELYHCMGYAHTNSRESRPKMPDLVNHCKQDVPWSDGLVLRWNHPSGKES